jgi:hypothetical protein
MATKSKTQATTATAVPQGVARTQANRKLRLLRTLKAQPNNTQVQTALLDTGTKRKAPITPQWSHSDIRLAKLFKAFSGRAPKELFSSNPKIQQAAISVPNTRVYVNLPQGKVDFSIGARAFIREGKVWS